jgi:hypothetical protein
MPQYIEYSTATGDKILVEVEGQAAPSRGGVVEAGIGDTARTVIVKAQMSFEGAVMDAMVRNARAFIQKMSELDPAPDEAELSFGLKATAEGNVAVVKTGTEAAYGVKLTWKRAPGA